MTTIINTKKRVKKIIIYSTITAAVLSAALFALWWFGAFIPDWAVFEEYSAGYETGYVELKGGSLRIYDGYADSYAKEGKPVWKSRADWRVQNLLIEDIDRDGREELLLLVWKHGNYGDHRPIWVEHNDIRLEQHIFIYKWDASREDRLKPIWMSSAVGYTKSIRRGRDKCVLVNTLEGESTLWRWRDFGLKIEDDNRESNCSVVCAGDNLLHPSLLMYGQKNLNDKSTDEYHMYDYLYDEIKDEISSADIAMVNQETPLVRNREYESNYPRFGTDSRVAYSLVNAGFDVINMSNNHMLDKGLYGIDSTEEVFVEVYGEAIRNKDYALTGMAGSGSTGDYRDSIGFVDHDGIIIAILGYTYGTNGIPMPEAYPHAVELFEDRARMTAQLEYARARADVVVVYAHWGNEYVTAISEQQKEQTDYMYEQGVDVIIGSHPHVVQDVEIVEKEPQKRMIVYYSLGNFMADQEAEATKCGALACLSIVKQSDGKTMVVANIKDTVIKRNDRYSSVMLK